MILGRTPAGAIKTKTDGGLRAVECACCEPQDFQPCRDCAPFSGNFTFSLAGDQVDITEEFQYPAIICPSDNCNLIPFPNIPPRICSDSWDAFGPGAMNYTNLYIVQIYRAGFGFFGSPPTQPCCWVLSLYVQGIFLFDFMGFQDLCFVNGEDSKIITSLDPRGSYPMTIFEQCIPPFMGGPTGFNFTVTVS
jgi:hypothetical protein